MALLDLCIWKACIWKSDEVPFLLGPFLCYELALMCEKRARKKLLCFPFFYNLNSVCCISTPKNCSVAYRFWSKNGHQLTPQFTQLFLFFCGPELPKEDDFLKCSIQQIHLIFHLHFANGKCYQVYSFCSFFLSFGRLISCYVSRLVLLVETPNASRVYLTGAPK